MCYQNWKGKPDQAIQKINKIYTSTKPSFTHGWNGSSHTVYLIFSMQGSRYASTSHHEMASLCTYLAYPNCLQMWRPSETIIHSRAISEWSEWHMLFRHLVQLISHTFYFKSDVCWLPTLTQNSTISATQNKINYIYLHSTSSIYMHFTLIHC
jgi:hypothetical protein